MDRFIDLKKTKLISYFIAISFLCIHTAFFLIFHTNGVTPMAYFNVFSITFFLVCLLLIRRGQLVSFVVATYVEVLAHMSLAVWYVGWGSGFQISLIGINLMLFLGAYLQKILEGRSIPAVGMSIGCMLTYLVLFVISRNRVAPYTLPETVNFWLQLFWSLVVFGMIIATLQGFVWLVFHSEKQLSGQVVTDSLTGLHNRYYISEHLKELEAKQRLERCWAAMMDIDDFKKLNDTYGHLFGDYVLRTVSKLMRESGVVAELCRWGGEEFLFVGYVDAGMEVHLARLDALRRTVEAYEFTTADGTVVHLTVTIGVAACQKGQTIDAWITAADSKLYEGKNTGKNQVTF